jgi:hypothetical protein
MILYGVHLGLKDLAKQVGGIYRSLASQGAPVVQEPADPFVEAVALVQEIA